MRHPTRCAWFLTTLLSAHAAHADPSVSVAVNPANTVPNVVANSIFADGGGFDWTTAAIRIDLNSGSAYQHPSGSDLPPNTEFFELFPGLEFDTYLGILDDAGGIAGGAGDLSSTGVVQSLDGPMISASWFNLALTDFGAVKIGNISLSDDATGSWSLAVTFANQPKIMYLSNPVVNGELVFDPLAGDLNYDGFVGISDLNTVLSAWNQNVPPGERKSGDPSGDGFVGIEDLNTVLGNWNAGFAPPPTVEPGLIGYDYNGDGFVGVDDQNIVLSNWNQNVSEYSMGDASGDGFVGIADMAYRNWNAGTPPQPVGGYTPPIVTPEPGTATLCIFLLVIGACRYDNR